MKTFGKNKYSFKCLNKQKASANAPKHIKKNKVQLESNVLDIDRAINNYTFLQNSSQIQNLIDNMNQESCEMHVINSIRNPNVPDTTHTTGLILEVSVAITISSEVNIKPILLNKVLIDQ